MFEYKISWREIWYEWTPSQVFMFLTRIAERYAKTKKRANRGKELKPEKLNDTAWMKG